MLFLQNYTLHLDITLYFFSQFSLEQSFSTYDLQSVNTVFEPTFESHLMLPSEYVCVAWIVDEPLSGDDLL